MNALVGLSELTAAPEGANSRLNGNCDTHGEYTVDAFYLSGTLRNPNPRCPQCVIAEGAAQGLKEAKECQKVSIDLMVGRSGIYPKMRNCKISGYQPVTPRAEANKKVCQSYVQSWGSTETSNGNILMVGRPGNGKTHLGCAMAMAVMARHSVQAIYTRADELVDYVNDAYDDSTDYKRSQALARFSDVPLLVLDELGAAEMTTKQRSLLSRIMDKRYLNMLPTIAMSNLTITELKAATDERMIDRLTEGALIMVFDWASHRGQNT